MVPLWCAAPAGARPDLAHPHVARVLFAAGPGAFFGSLANETLIPPLYLDGATLRLVTSNESYGLGLAGMSALHVSARRTSGPARCMPQRRMRACQPRMRANAAHSTGPASLLPPLPPPLSPAAARPQITLEPCTVLQPHTHPHSEFVFTLKGEVTHSIPFYNGSLTDVKENTATGFGSPGFAVFPANHLHGAPAHCCRRPRHRGAGARPALRHWLCPCQRLRRPRQAAAALPALWGLLCACPRLRPCLSCTTAHALPPLPPCLPARSHPERGVQHCGADRGV